MSVCQPADETSRQMLSDMDAQKHQIFDFAWTSDIEIHPALDLL